MNIYEIQNENKTPGNGKSGSFVTFIQILSHLFGFSIFIVPMVLKQVGLINFSIGLVTSVMINLFMLWQINRSSTYYDNQFESLMELIHK